MTFTLHVHPAARSTLTKAAENGEGDLGWLVGVRNADGVVVLSAARHSEGQDSEQSKESVLAVLPAGLEIVGSYSANGAAPSQKGGKASDVVAVASASGVSFASASGSALEPVATSEDWVQQSLCLLRFRAAVTLTVASPASASAFEAAANAAADQLCGDSVALLVSAAAAARQPAPASAQQAQAPARALIAPEQRPDEPPALASSFCVPGGPSAAVSALQPPPAPSSAAAAPVIASGPAQGSPHALSVDVLAYAAPGAQLSLSAGPLAALRAAVRRQLAQAAALLAADPSKPARPIHFAPPGLAHAIIPLYPLPKGGPEPGPAADAALAPARAALHRAWGLASRPLLRLSNAADVDQPAGAAAAKEGARLRDVHHGLRGLVPGGAQTLVQGSYFYYHYMQDKFDDKGWGCAYRSCQTLVSWFRCQHYTSVPVPSHRDIQELLVRLGDKPASFVGSSQWIGAIELGFVLDELLGVTCKVMRTESGWDIPSRARELAAHFATQGTPVMIGGGMLAYTLLGVDFNELTGEVAFLILDPHYTGGEDLKTIQPQWCGWKKAESVFVRDSFYNLLMPQCPKEV